MSQCPHCHTPDSGGGAFCANCGQPVAPGAAAPPPYQEPVAPAQAQLPLSTPQPPLNTPPPPGHPGAPTPPYQAAPLPYGQPQKRPNTFKIMVLAFVGTLAVVFALMLIGVFPNPFKSEPQAGPGPAQQPGPQTTPSPGPGPSQQPGPGASQQPQPGPAETPAPQPVTNNEMIPDPGFAGSINAMWELAAAYGPMLLVSQEVAVYPIDVEPGDVLPLFEFTSPQSGWLLDMVVGDAYNDGNPGAFVVFENQVLVVRHSGESHWIDGTATQARIADFNGDGYNEVLFHEVAEGQAFYELWQYVGGGSQRLAWVARNAPPETYQSPVKVGGVDYLLGWDLDHQVVFYGWDDTNGLVEAARFVLVGPDPFWWLAGDSDGAVWVSRMGDYPYLELYEPNGSTWELSGAYRLPGEWPYALFTFKYDDGEEGLMLLSLDGNYLVY